MWLMAILVGCNSTPLSGYEKHRETLLEDHREHKKRVSQTGIDSGWRGLKWATPPAANTRKVLQDVLGDTYVIKDDKLSVGEIPLASIEYTFWENQLWRIHLEADSKEHCVQISDGLRTKYGQPSEINPHPLSLDPDISMPWYGLKSEILFIHPMDSWRCSLIYTYDPVDRARKDAFQAEKQKARQAAAEDL